MNQQLLQIILNNKLSEKIEALQECLLMHEHKTIVEAMKKPDLFFNLFFELLPALQTTPRLRKLLIKAVVPYRKKQIKKWMSRTLIPYKNASHKSFCKLAVQLIHEKYPDFPDIDHRKIELTGSYYCASVYEFDTLRQTNGWRVYLEHREIGPAEIIHEEEWRAVAYNPQKIFILQRDESNGDEVTWYEWFDG